MNQETKTEFSTARYPVPIAGEILQAEEKGLLDTEIQLSSETLSAGKDFSVFMIVRNPFNRPIWIDKVFMTRPNDLVPSGLSKEAFRKIQKIQQKQEYEDKKRTEDFNLVIGELRHMQSRIDKGEMDFSAINGKLSDIEKAFINDSKYGLHVKGPLNVTNAEIQSDHSSIYTEGEVTIRNLVVNDPVRMAGKLLSQNEVELLSSLPRGAALQPGSTAVYKTSLRVRDTLFFTPTSYRLQFSVNYAFASPEPDAAEMTFDRLSSNSFAHDIIIRPHVCSVISGAGIGGFAGALAQTLQTLSFPLQDFAVLWTMGVMALSVVFGVLAAILLTRKSETQSFVSVEDFWGGLLIGALTGFAGASFFGILAGTGG